MFFFKIYFFCKWKSILSVNESKLITCGADRRSRRKKCKIYTIFSHFLIFFFSTGGGEFPDFPPMWLRPCLHWRILGGKKEKCPPPHTHRILQKKIAICRHILSLDGLNI